MKKKEELNKEKVAVDEKDYFKIGEFKCSEKYKGSMKIFMQGKAYQIVYSNPYPDLAKVLRSIDGGFPEPLPSKSTYYQNSIVEITFESKGGTEITIDWGIIK